MIFINKSMISYMKYDDYNDNHCDNHCDDIELELYNTYIIKYAGHVYCYDNTMVCKIL